MSAIVTQLSYNINEKLHIDDSPFPTFQQATLHKDNTEKSLVANKPSTSCPYPVNNNKDNTGNVHWTPAANAAVSPTTQSTSLLGVATASGSSSSSSLFSSPAHNLRFSSRAARCKDATDARQLDPSSSSSSSSRQSAFRREKNLTPTAETVNSGGHNNKKVPCSPGLHRGGVSTRSSRDRDNDINSSGASSSSSTTNVFPSIVGRSCTLHTPKLSNSSPKESASFAGIPPIKRHCRSVSEPEDLGFPVNFTSPVVSTSWKPGGKVWRKPIRKLQHRAGGLHRTYHSSTSFSLTHPAPPASDCSSSLDCASLHSESAAITGGSLLTPPASPVPRPASVTVIKHEGGAWSFLSSRRLVSDTFSPLSSPCRNAEGSSYAGGLSATKRSLSFSEDFEYRESIHYTPCSTPESERRFTRYSSSLHQQGLLRCQSHPADLNVKKTKIQSRRRSSRLAQSRPTLDFQKMKQTSFSKRGRARQSALSQDNNNSNVMIASCSKPPSCSSHLLQPNNNNVSSTVNPIFPSIVAPTTNEFNIPETGESMMLNRPLFSVPPLKPLDDIRSRILSPTDEHPDDVVGDDVTPGTTSGGVAAHFVRECTDLNIDEIENDDS